ncbi:MAG: putative RNA uridine N3 methyltransferase, partial [Candidatus Baldrarchaeota archaeon]
SPREGLHEILKRESKKLSDVADYIVNMIPGQGVRTVRTEEAIYASLTIINFLQFLCFKK